MSYDATYVRWFGGAIAVLLLASCAATTPIAPADLVVVAPRMLDVRNGRYLRDRMVVVRDGRIAGIHPASRAADVVSKDRFVLPPDAILIPGLIDTHVHLAWDGGQNEDAARLTLLAGFTTVRNPGASGNADVVLRNAIEEGRVAGPRMLIARTGIGAPGGVCAATFGEAGVATPDDARERVRKLIGEGADFIKICAGGGVVGRPADATVTEMSQETIDAIVDEAHRAGRRVAAHAQGADAIRAAVNGGVDSIEHGGLIDDDTARLMASKRVPLVPTLARLQNPKIREDTLARVRHARELGVPIVFGTDAGVLPHGENAKEFASLLAIGMTPLEAIRAATIDAARLIGWEGRVGSIEPGFEADLVVITGDVLKGEPIQVDTVIARGRVVR
ncbi:MAG TPA: amidohydrolase family protein [Thermoanaerobaculia bacterium]|nr:amidohydrolase family protein [Thermoanaerobaculia bacterium]